jgi:co-chaperonin GroES (HSP10)
MAYGDAHQIKSIRPLHDQVIVSEMSFKERITTSGIIVLGDDGKSEGIRPRWGKVYAVGPKQKDYKVGQWIMVAHGRWTRGATVEVDGKEISIRKVDLEEILLVSDEQPDDSTMSTVEIPERAPQ